MEVSMKLLSVNKFFYLKGGSERYFFELNNELMKNGNEIIDFSMKDNKNYKSEFKEFFIENIDYADKNLYRNIKNALKIIYSFEAKKKLSKLIKKTKPDLAHLHIFQHQLSYSILDELKKNNIPIIYTAHELKFLCPNYKMLNSKGLCEKCKYKKYYNCLLNKCSKNSFTKSFINVIEMYVSLLNKSTEKIDKFIVPSMFYYNKFIEFGFEKEKLVYIPNFIDTKNYKPEFIPGKYILYFGRLSREKGIITLLNVMEKLSGIKIYFVGNGPLKNLVEEKSNQFKNIKFLGFKNGEELFEIIKNSSFTIIPSEWYENCPLSVLESFAFGKPVIGSDLGGIPELIINEKTGFIFEAGNEKKLKEKIEYLYGNKKLIKKMGIEARKDVEFRFDKKNHIEQILKIYKVLLNK
jgi:glycosyltransferase involved in cell wall biosynthesis